MAQDVPFVPHQGSATIPPTQVQQPPAATQHQAASVLVAPPAAPVSAASVPAASAPAAHAPSPTVQPLTAYMSAV
ncbi:hypothetical protein U1Q18_017623 [Sarracenia purpurea var. burkii]